MSASLVLRAVLVVVLVLLVQATLGTDLTIAGAHPEIMLLLPIAAGIAAGPEEGAVMGFFAGLAADTLLSTPFGLWALVGCLVGFGVGYATGSLVREVWWLPALVALAGSAVAVMLYAVLGAVLGQSQFFQVDLLAVVLVVGVCNALLVAPAVRLVGWTLSDARDEGSDRAVPTTGGRGR